MTDLTSPGSSVTIATVSGGDAIFQYGVPVGSGTGIYNTFLATQSTDGTAEGYNSNAGGNYLDTNSAKTESIQLSTLQTTVIDGVEYYIFRLDLNESPDQVQLNQLKVYVSPNEAAAADFNNTTDTFSNGTQTYTPILNLDMTNDETLLLTEHSSGSGTDDYSLLIPVDAFPASGYVTLYTDFGGPSHGNVNDPNAEDGGFDEWAAFSIPSTGDGDPAIKVVKTPDITTIAEGTTSDIVYTYAVTNESTSDTDPLTINSLVDDVLGDITANYVSGDDGDGLLEKGETWIYQATATDQTGNVGDDITNVVTVTGTDDDGTEATDDDTATVTITDVAPDIKVVKTPDITTIAEGTTSDIVYTYAVTNESTSDTDPLTINSLVDDVLGDITANYVSGDDGNGLLEKGETWIYQATATDQTGNVGDDITNVVTVTGTDDDGTEATDDDTATVTITDVAPDIKVVKTPDITTIAEGTTSDIVYTYAVTNESTSDTDPLTINSLVDDVLGDITANYVSGDDGNGLLEKGETWIYQATATDQTGNVGDDITNVVTVTGTDDDGTEATDDDTATVTITDVAPDIKVVKTPDITTIAEGTTSDIVYTYAVTNESTSDTDPLTINSLVDDVLGDITANYVSGDDGNGLLEKGETWIYQATATDQTGNVGDDITNVVTVTGTDDDGTEATDDDTATVTITNVAPAIAIVKTVDANGDNVFNDQETVQAGGDSVTYQYVITNTSTAGVDPLTLDDLVDDMGSLADVNLMVDGALQAGVTLVKAGGNQDSLLETGETWTFKYTTNVNLSAGQTLTNTATVTAVDDENASATASDTASVEALAGPGVRTPGFWSNLGKQFWDGVSGNEGKSGPNFPTGELVYKVDSNNDGVKDNTAGLLIGDYNKDGITDNGEDTFFISLTDAVKVINASTKESQDTRFVLARDAVATWLNFLAGNPIGDASDPNSPHKYLDQAIDWLQVTNGGNAGSTWENWGGGSAVKAGGNTIWNNASNTENATAGNELPGVTIHSELDFFNNTGMTFLGVNTFNYANDGG